MSDDFDPGDLPSDPVEAATWLEENIDDLSAEELQAVYDQFHYNATSGGMGSPDMAVWSDLAGIVTRQIEDGGESGREELLASAAEGPISNAIEAGGVPQVGGENVLINAQREARRAEERQDAIDSAANYVAGVLERTGSGIAPDLSGIDEFIPNWMTEQEKQRFIGEARDAGLDIDAERVDAELAGQGLSEDERVPLVAERRSGLTGLIGTNTPVWLLKFAGGDLTDVQKQRFVDYWNDDHGTNYTTFSEVIPVLERMGETTYTQSMTNAVLADQEPLISHSIEIPLVAGARRVSMSETEMETLRGMGLSNDAIVRLVRLTGITGGADSITPGPNGDTLEVGRIAALAGLTRYFGGGTEFARFQELSQEVNQLEKAMGLDPEEFRNMTYKERQALRTRLQNEYLARLPPSERKGAGLSTRVQALDRAESLLRQQGRLEEGRLPGVLGAQNMYNRGLQAYNGDQVLAFISAVDNGLAQRIAATGGDLSKLDGADNVAALNIMDRGGLINRGNTAFERLGGRIGETVMSHLTYFDIGRGARGSGGSSGGGTVRREVDPAQVREQVQQMWSQWFLADVDDATVEAITKNLQSQLDAAPQGMSFDVSARITEFLRGNPLYDTLYKNKPGGMTEEDYRTQFSGAVADMLGGEANEAAVRAGMTEGNYQTAVGRATASKALMTNSRLRGRVAEAKQVLDRFT